MRLAAIASVLAILRCVAFFGAILFQKASLPVPAPAPPQATPTDGPGPGSAVAVTESALQGPRVVAIVGELEPTGMAQHSLTDALDEAVEANRADWPAASWKPISC